MIFVISTSIEGGFKYNNFYWSNKYFSDIKNSLTCDYNSLSSINKAILYYNKTNQKLKNAIMLDVISVEAKETYLKINFNIGETLDFQSFLVKNAIKKCLNRNSIFDLPFLSVVDESTFFGYINDMRIISSIKVLEEKNCWEEIFNLMQKFQPLDKNLIWNDAELLNAFSFATAKLSECTENLNKKFKDRNQKNDFINEKKSFRELTLKIRKRLTELQPQNASFWSNLAYSYYQSVNELATPGGRRDGNIFEDADTALIYLDKALEIDSKRVTDLYRKAKLHSDILGEYKFFREFNPENPAEKYNELSSALEKAIDNFTKVVSIYESANNPEAKAKLKKVYVKTLYNLAQKHIKLAKIHFSNQNQFPHNAYSEFLLADSYIDKCITEDYNKAKPETEIIEKANVNNFICGVYKSYLKGSIQMHLYLITNDNEHSKNAFRFLQLAMETNFPKEMRNQNKLFILEKIASFNLIKENYSAAINALEPLYNRNPKIAPFAAYTLALAYLKNNQNEKASQIINNFKNCPVPAFKYKFEKLNERLLLNNLKISNDELLEDQINHEND